MLDQDLTENNLNDQIDTKSDFPRKIFRRYNIIDATESVDYGVLPEGWIRVTHISGLSLYLHRPSRVVSTSRPYCIGPGSVRHHKIPSVSIPCLAYRRHRGEQFHEPETPPSIVTANHAGSDQSSQSQADNKSQDTSLMNLFKSPELPSMNTIPVKSSDTPSLSSNQSECSDSRESILDNSITSITSATTQSPYKPTHSFSSPSKRKRRRMQHSSAFFSRESSELDSTPSSLVSSDIASAKAQVFTFKDNELNALLSPEEIRSYCSRLFEVKVEESVDNRSRGGRISQETNQSQNQDSFVSDSIECEAPPLMLSEKTKLIRFEVPAGEGRKSGKEGVINITGKSYVCILHDYCQYVTGSAPSYQRVSSSEDPSLSQQQLPYQTTVVINGQPRATGSGSSKKQARLDAARKALEALIPNFAQVVATNSASEVESIGRYSSSIGGDRPGSSSSSSIIGQQPSTSTPLHTSAASVKTASCSSDVSDADLRAFETIKPSDPRLADLSMRMSMPLPYAVLIECLARSCIAAESDLKSSMMSVGRKRSTFTLQLNDHIVTVPCKNKRSGRHLAAQRLLTCLHPELASWADFLRLYGPGTKPEKHCEMAVRGSSVTGPSKIDSVGDELDRGSEEEGEESQENNDQTSSSSTSQKPQPCENPKLIQLLRSKMLQLAEIWDKNGGPDKLKGKFNVSPADLPVINYHPDSQTNLYRSMPGDD